MDSCSVGNYLVSIGFAVWLGLGLSGCGLADTASIQQFGERDSSIIENSSDSDESMMYTSYNHQALESVNSSMEGRSGGAYSHQYRVIGTVADLEPNNSIAKIEKRNSDKWSEFLLDDIYIDYKDYESEIFVGDKIEISFLLTPSNEIINPSSIVVL